MLANTYHHIRDVLIINNIDNESHTASWKGVIMWAINAWAGEMKVKTFSLFLNYNE